MELLAQMQVEYEGFQAALNDKAKPAPKGQWGKQAKGMMVQAGKGQSKSWWCPPLKRDLTLADFDDVISELEGYKLINDEALLKQQQENTAGSALQQAIYKIARVKGLEQLPDPRNKKGKGKHN